MGLNNYKVIRKIGEGGSGLTYLARDSSGIERCLKEFRFGMKKGEEETFKARELFEREAQTLESLNHPQIPRYLDFFAGGDNGEERLYLVMEHIPGKTLDDLLKSKRFNEEGVLMIAKKVTNILEYLHSFSPPVIHRDIKPKNLIETPEGAIKLLDFGSVADKVLQNTRFSVTRVGSFGFAAPELTYGKPVPASDIYSLGATLISLLSGGADPVSLMNDDHRLDFKGKLNVSKKTENLLLDMTEPSLSRRIPNTEVLRQRLYGNGHSNSSAFKTTNDVVIHYDDIKHSYSKLFSSWGWTLEEVLEKVNKLFSGIKSIEEDYGKELIIFPVTMKIVYEGKNVEVHSPEEVLAILPERGQQKEGLKEVSTAFSTSDGKLDGWLKYENIVERGYYTTISRSVNAHLHPKGFTEKDRGEYERLVNFLRKVK